MKCQSEARQLNLGRLFQTLTTLLVIGGGEFVLWGRWGGGGGLGGEGCYIRTQNSQKMFGLLFVPEIS